MNNAKELFLYGLNNILDAEQRLVPALEEMASQTHEPELAKAFESHKEQTEKQIERLEEVFDEMEEESEPSECRGMAALIEERNNFHQQQSPSPDIAAIFDTGAASQIESYEINAYNALIVLAQELELDHSVKLLNQTLKEEQQALAKMEKFQSKIQPEELEPEEIEEGEEIDLEAEEEPLMEEEGEEELAASEEEPETEERTGRQGAQAEQPPRGGQKKGKPKKGRAA